LESSILGAEFSDIYTGNIRGCSIPSKYLNLFNRYTEHE
jgi:hypothetical protein